MYNDIFFFFSSQKLLHFVLELCLLIIITVIDEIFKNRLQKNDFVINVIDLIHVCCNHITYLHIYT